MSEEHHEVRTSIRVPDDVYRQIEALAKEEIRSIHNQTIMLIKEALRTRYGGYKRSICPKCGEVME